MFAFVLMCSESRSLVILRACRFFGSAAPSFSDQQLEYAVESCVDALDALAHEHRYRRAAPFVTEKKTKTKTYWCVKCDKRKFTFEEVVRSGTSSFSCTCTFRVRFEEADCCAGVL